MRLNKPDIDSDALAATERGITDDYRLVAKFGIGDNIPSDELIATPNPKDYLAPAYLGKIAPELASVFKELLGVLEELNGRYAGDRTVLVEAYFSLTGEHEELEEAFLEWCQRYFKIRGNLDRLNPQMGSDPWRLYQECIEEFQRLLGARLIAPNTLNCIVLNLSQRYMLSAFASDVMLPDLEAFARDRRDRFGSDFNRKKALQFVSEYQDGYGDFGTFLQLLAEHLPAECQARADESWFRKVTEDIRRQSEDLAFLRPILCKVDHSKSPPVQLAPSLWGRLRWDVYHGSSIAVVLTSSTKDELPDKQSNHPIAIRRDGSLCHREFSWVRVDPKDLSIERAHELAVNWYLLDTFATPLIQIWEELDRDAIVTHGSLPDATEDEQVAALAIELAEFDPAPDGDRISPKRRLPQLRLKRIERILTAQFDCDCRDGKGSERVVSRPGHKHFRFGRHGVDPPVLPNVLQRCLKSLGILVADFISASR